MKSQAIRDSFRDFFHAQDHRAVPSAPLVPHGDPTLLFTNAGMVPFKDCFLGRQAPPHPRAVSVQKCLRVSGKHNDLENVGPSPRHHTFFEMLGNFSFGDYFKEEAIRLAWALVTEVWSIPPDRLFATVFEEDDEAHALWTTCSTLPTARIQRCGAADNFWAMGETGPCGPSSEIFVDRYPDRPLIPFAAGNENGRYIEIWNLVFMQYERDAAGTLSSLPNPSIDTGAGLERLSAVLQGGETNYDSDLFQPILRATAALVGVTYGQSGDADISLRVIADHLRAVSFLLADGVIPGPDGRGYVLRRLLRRAVRHGMRLGFEEPFLYRLVPVLEETMGAAYPELVETRAATVSTLGEEEEKYLSTRAAGARRVQEAIDAARRAGHSALAGDAVFQLYDTHGVEIETVREIAEEERLEIDEAGFEAHLEARRQSSRDATGAQQQRVARLREALATADGEASATAFEGYDSLVLEAAQVERLAALKDASARAVETLAAGSEGLAVLDRTVFYAEAGGQVGDRGTLRWPGGWAHVVDTQKDTTGTVFHLLRIEEGSLAVGATVALEVDTPQRRATERNHTATHLLHAALRQVLGEGVRQSGSHVAPDRLRFDFTYGQPLAAPEVARIEALVNRHVQRAVATQIQQRSYREALAAGAVALFGEKYGDEVRTVEVPGFSLELCGGCHVRNSGEIGLFLVTGERGVASGVRRVEAVTGEEALARVQAQQTALAAVEQALSAPAARAAEEVVGLKERVKTLERELSQLRVKLAAGDGGGGDGEQEVAGIRVAVKEVPGAQAKELRPVADTLRDRLGSGVVVLAARDGGKVSLVVTVSKDLTGRIKAGDLIKPLAAIVGGGGGGRPDFAQAGGREPDKLPALLAAVPAAVEAAIDG